MMGNTAPRKRVKIFSEESKTLLGPYYSFQRGAGITLRFSLKNVKTSVEKHLLWLDFRIVIDFR